MQGCGLEPVCKLRANDGKLALGFFKSAIQLSETVLVAASCNPLECCWRRQVDHWTLIWLAYVALPACFACRSATLSCSETAGAINLISLRSFSAEVWTSVRSICYGSHRLAVSLQELSRLDGSCRTTHFCILPLFWQRALSSCWPAGFWLDGHVCHRNRQTQPSEVMAANWELTIQRSSAHHSTTPPRLRGLCFGRPFATSVLVPGPGQT